MIPALHTVTQTIESEDVWEDASRDLLDFMLRDAGIVDELFASTQDSPPSYADGDFEGALGVFEMKKRKYRSSYLRGVFAVFDCKCNIRTSNEPAKASNHPQKQEYTSLFSIAIM